MNANDNNDSGPNGVKSQQTYLLARYVEHKIAALRAEDDGRAIGCFTALRQADRTAAKLRCLGIPVPTVEYEGWLHEAD